MPGGATGANTSSAREEAPTGPGKRPHRELSTPFPRERSMSRTYADVMQEMAALKAEAERLKADEIAEVIARIKHAIAVYGLSAADLGFPRPGRKPGTKPAKAAKGRAAAAKKATAGVKFRDGNNVWVGRGPRPKWLREALLAGKSLKDFAV